MLEFLLQLARSRPELLVNFGGLLVAAFALRILAVELRGLRKAVTKLSEAVAGREQFAERQTQYSNGVSAHNH